MKHGIWKTLERKWEEKLFWSVFDWVGRKKNKWWGLSVFSSSQPKCFLPKMRKKLSGDEFFLLTKMPMCMCTWALQVAFIFFFPLPWAVSNIAFFFLFFATLPLLFSFDFLGLGLPFSFLFFSSR